MLDDVKDVDLGNVYLNTTASLTVDKRSRKQATYQRALAWELQYHITVERVDANKFLLDPFVRDVGIAVARDVEYEDHRVIRFATFLLFPDGHLDLSVDPVKNYVKYVRETFDKS